MDRCLCFGIGYHNHDQPMQTSQVICRTWALNRQGSLMLHICKSNRLYAYIKKPYILQIRVYYFKNSQYTSLLIHTNLDVPLVKVIGKWESKPSEWEMRIQTEGFEGYLGEEGEDRSRLSYENQNLASGKSK